jgi:hypothetical protein
MLHTLFPFSFLSPLFILSYALPRPFRPAQLLTLGCGKFRLINQEFGNLPGTGLPRLLDMGQCNDA